MHVGDVFNDRYTIERKLGWGHFSTVWLASDSKVPDNHPHKLVAIKVQKSAAHYTEAALDEISLLSELRAASTPRPSSSSAAAAAGSGSSRASAAAAGVAAAATGTGSSNSTFPDTMTATAAAAVDDAGAGGAREAGSEYVIHLLDNFIVHGPHGKHVCLVFETMGQNLLALIKRYDYRGIPAFIVKIMAKQLLEGLAFMHDKCSIIHTDLKPENFMMRSPPIDVDEARFNRREAMAAASQRTATAQAMSENPVAGLRPAFPGAATNLPGQGGQLSKSQKKRLREKAKKAAAAAAAAGGSGAAGSDDDDDDAAAADKGGKNESHESNETEDCEDETGKPWLARRRAYADLVAQKSPYERALLQYSIKIADLGNGCWKHKHFTSDVTTRQYRAPEVIVGYEYSTPIDIWSVACIVFELLTGDYLFDPKADPGRHTRNEDHLALIIELLGSLPKKLTSEGTQSKQYFTKRGDLINIKSLEEWPLQEVLTQKYHVHPRDSDLLCAFLLPMLSVNPSTRATASEALASEWLRLNPIDWYHLHYADGTVDEMPAALRVSILTEEKERVAEATAAAREAGINALEPAVLAGFKPYHGWLERRDRDPDEELAKALAEVEDEQTRAPASTTTAGADAEDAAEDEGVAETENGAAAAAAAAADACPSSASDGYEVKDAAASATKPTATGGPSNDDAIQEATFMASPGGGAGAGAEADVDCLTSALAVLSIESRKDNAAAAPAAAAPAAAAGDDEAADGDADADADADADGDKASAAVGGAGAGAGAGGAASGADRAGGNGGGKKKKNKKKK